MTMMNMSSEEVFISALCKYGLIPENEEIEQYNQELMEVLLEKKVNQNKGTFVVTTDIGEDTDDAAMCRYCFMNTTANLIVVMSNGYQTSQWRMDTLKDLFPCFKDIDFNIPFVTKYNTILFVKDGSEIDVPLDGYVNAGPCHSRTLASIGKMLKKNKNTKVVTVGAKDDCKLAGGINQKQTDEEGKLINIPNVWDDFIEEIQETDYKNLSTNVSRFVLFPNPLTMLDTPYGEMANEKCMQQFVDNTGMFLACRPSLSLPPKVILHINSGNSVVDYQLVNNLEYNEDYIAGIEKLDEIRELVKSNGLSPDIEESLAIPIVFTNYLGGRYKKGQFGWTPGNEKDKREVSCLTPASALIFKENIKNLKKMTPAYDVLAFNMVLK